MTTPSFQLTLPRIIYSSIAFLYMLLLTSCGGGVVGDDKNFIVVKDQSLIYLNEVVIESVTADQNVLILVYAENPVLPNVKSNRPLGFTPVAAGEYDNVIVKLERDVTDSETFFVELRVNKGDLDEFDGADTIINQLTANAVSFGVARSTDPFIEAWVDAAHEHSVSSLAQMTNSAKPFAGSGTQYIIPADSRIDLKKVITNENSFLAVHRVNADSSTDLVKSQLFEKGHYSEMVIDLGEKLVVGEGEYLTIGLYRAPVDGGAFDENLKVNLNGEHVQIAITIEL